MASTTDMPDNEETFEIEPSAKKVETWETWGAVQKVLKPLASLKLTVCLFPAAIFIVLAGTFAQVNDDIWTVVNEYFRVNTNNLLVGRIPFFNFKELFVWIDGDIFLPESFFPATPSFPDNLTWMASIWPDGTKDLPNWCGIWFPKGWTIGIVMALNLLAAHTVRFKVQASGTRLTIGSVVLIIGSIFTYLVILSGSSNHGLQAKPLIDYDTLRIMMLTTLFGLCGASIYGTIASEKKEQRWLCGIGSILLALTAMFTAQWQANDEASMRILYQLVKATFAALILLAGCIAVFKKRAGVVLLHAGIGLMMFYDVLVGVNHIESQMTIIEGETTSYSRDIREVEFAVIDRSGQDEEIVTVVGQSKIDDVGEKVSDQRLPFDIEVVKFFLNSDVRGLRGFEDDEEVPENYATKGVGTSVVAADADNVKGTDTGGGVDMSSLYVKLTSKDGEDLGTYLTSSIFDLTDNEFGKSQTVEVDGKNYDIGLRFVRYYYDFQVTLNDVQKNDYKGTSKVKDYSSYITLNDPENDLEFDFRIWMNNPMRFAGKTFYQSNYGMVEGGKEFTTFQVVDNVGWMTPYVSCMIVWVGMMFHFGLTLLRYLGRRARLIALETEASREAMKGPLSTMDKIGWGVSIIICGGIILSVAMLGRAPSETDDEFHVAEFGELPMWYKGRSMPIDSFANNSLLRLADYESYRDAEGEKHSATEWVLSLMADEEKARDARIFKIENKEVIEALGLEDRKRFTYSFNELLHSDKIDGIKEMGMLTILRGLEGLTEIDSNKPREFDIAASETPEAERSLFQRKIIELSRKIDDYVLFEFTLGNARIVDLMKDQSEAPEGTPAIAELAFKLREFNRLHKQAFRDLPIALVVPTHLNAGKRPENEVFQTEWESVAASKIFNEIYSEMEAIDTEDEFNKPPAISEFISLLNAYKAGEVETFNKNLKEYRALLNDYEHEKEDANLLTKTKFEAVYNRFGAFNLASWLYVFAGILGSLGWLFFPQIFQRAAFWTIATVFVIHTAALLGRIYISGRPPVTNLYSSAIFIGWAVVLGSLILEKISKLGAASLVGADVGFLSLRIADTLSGDDTFVVLEAVLDTQFWLATHVVCITLGYATTYLAGFFGILYLLAGIFTPKLDKTMAKEVSRMIYGVLCFATFFSFVGTVLGGLWADDSWGRFWGWDPKENGALIIVLWNALVIHARWGNIVKDKGSAILVVLGNIVVSWSWFGVNELGVGKHSYGFTQGVLAWLTVFMASQLLIASLGFIPKSLWMSKPDEDRKPKDPDFLHA
ncbi:cytochrome c biogenesis protein CcsA [Planctomicrobium sp.]|jgi:ABC-type transport system involved in cytochrome c biogenesis permease subunit|nr:cytochrome c biogenesis protein CcsA [bacterium]MDB4439644.1 cytochrome c biogenesis protein CcsA [Planctomicrobium sp.]